jgi:hypothetical protein
MCPLARAVADRRFLLWALAWSVVALVAFGFVSAILPNPVFGRSVPPEPFAIVVWLVSAPLMGLLAATYTVPARGDAAPMTLGPVAGPSAGPPLAAPGERVTFAASRGSAAAGPVAAPAVAAVTAGSSGTAAATMRADGSLLATVAGFGAFLAIGCPLCNKVVLIALGASGAMSIWAPIQPILGVASVLLLGVTVVWRLRRRAAGDACAVPVRLGRSA